jgi:hypothetical protein
MTTNSDNPTPTPIARMLKKKITMEPLILLAFLVVWIVLQVWVLPKAGVRT